VALYSCVAVFTAVVDRSTIGENQSMSDSKQNGDNEAQLLALFDSLEPWTDPGRMDSVAWSRYIEVARQVQQTDPATVERALSRFVKEAARAQVYSDESESKVFLLLRVVFELPSSAPEEQRRSFKGWINWPEADESGRVNPSWPIVWEEGGPRLEARYEGSEGRPYAADLEYRYFRENYPYRNPSELR
jgi:hypothetical protein